jgi:spore germination cell wall hydrolase CwlJ-like protein
MQATLTKTLCVGTVGLLVWMARGATAHGPGEIYMRLISEEALAVITIMQEAEGEPYLGKLAVAEVIRNRMKLKYASNGTVAGTVLRAKQFSGWNATSTKSDPYNLFRIRSVQIDSDDPIVKDCIRAWHEAQAGSNTVHGAVLYYAPATLKKLGWPEPDWAMPDSADEVAIVGQHHFFVPKPRPGTVKV